MERIKTQANRLWQLISDPATAATYQQMIAVTWAILKETAQLLLYVLFLTVVLGEWFYHTAVQSGRKTRIWVENLQQQTTSDEPKDPTAILRETGKSLLAVGQSGMTLAVNTAKEQLGMEVPPTPDPSVKPNTPTTPAIAPKPAVTAPPTAPTADAPLESDSVPPASEADSDR